MKSVDAKGFSPFSKITKDPVIEKRTKIGCTYMGKPYRGDPQILLKDSDPASKKPRYTASVFMRIFDMSNAEDLKAYTDVYNGVANETYMIDLEKIEYDNKLQNWKILLRWVEPYYTTPKG